ncbi:hypothetical protein [Saccharothrix hoggarensis]|uniref:WXG100 family type VII secretion target n=1 Tax=Saccharothrix hoggarensis TaxID=913853 RepID=A0ABW3R5J5_9PSEU
MSGSVFEYDLDPAFTEAQRGLYPLLVVLHGWVSYLAVESADPMERQRQVLQGLPVPGVAYEDFFRVPMLLTGQPLDEIGAVYEALVRNSREIDNGMEEFQVGCANAFRNWTGSAQEACAKYGGALMDYVNDERDAAERLAAVLLAYGGIVKSARDDWLRLADQFVDALRQKVEDDRASNQKILFTAIGALAGAALAIVTAPVGGIGGTFVAAVGGAIADVGAEAAKESLEGEEFADIAHRYLAACREFEDRLTRAIKTEVADKLSDLNQVRPAPPSSPLDVGTFDHNPKGYLEPEHTTPGVERWLDEKEERAREAGPSTISARLG